MFKSFIADKLTSTNAWTAVVLLVVALFLPRTIIFTLAVVLFFVPDSVVATTIGKLAPKLKAKLDSWH